MPTCLARVGEVALTLRPDSWDYGIARSVLVDDEYRLPARFAAADVVLDIGAHIGSFACACLQRGAGRVIAYEPDPDNAAIAAENLRPFAARAELHAAAVWRSDRTGDRLRLRGARHRLNTGGHDVLSDADDGMPIAVVALDDVLARLRGRVRLMKIDCEGAEYPILMTAARLDRVDAIVGEYHLFSARSEHGEAGARMRVDGVERYDAESLAARLRAHGFEVEVAAAPSRDHGLFFARRAGRRIGGR